MPKGRGPKRDKGYFLVVDVPYTEKLHELDNYLPFLPEMQTEKLEKLELIYMIKLNMLNI